MNPHHTQVIRSVPVSVPSKPATGSGRLFGAILVDAERLSNIDVERILSFQANGCVRFGDAGQAKLKI